MDGLYLKDGQNILNGTKTAVAAPGPRDIVGSRVLITKDADGVYYDAGVVEVGAAEVVNIAAFDERVEEHGISPLNRQRWWPGKDELYIYAIDAVKLWDQPRKLDLGPGLPMSVRLDDGLLRAVVLARKMLDAERYLYVYGVIDG